MEAVGTIGVVTVGALVLVGCFWRGVLRVQNPPILASSKPASFRKAVQQNKAVVLTATRPYMRAERRISARATGREWRC